MGKPKILYLTYDGLTDALGQSQIIPYLIGLSAQHEITIVSFEKKKHFSSRAKKVFEVLTPSITWIPKLYTKYPPVISTIIDLFRLKSVCNYLLIKHPFHVVHCRSYLTSLIGLYLKKRYRLKFIFDMRGFWIEERVEGGLWNLNNPVHFAVHRYFKWKEKRFLLNADNIVVLTKKAKNILINEYAVRDHLITVIPCCVDIDLFDHTKVSSQQKVELRKKLNIKPDDFVMIYSGSIGTWYMMNEMLDLFGVCLKRRPNMKFLFVTNESESAIVNSVKKKDIPSSQIMIASAGRPDMPLFLSMADISIFFIRPTFSKQASSPTKFAETLAMGLPIITNSNIGDLDEYFINNEVGVLVKSFTKEEYLKVSDGIYNLTKIDKSNIRERAILDFSLNEGINRYKRILQSL